MVRHSRSRLGSSIRIGRRDEVAAISKKDAERPTTQAFRIRMSRGGKERDAPI